MHISIPTSRARTRCTLRAGDIFAHAHKSNKRGRGNRVAGMLSEYMIPSQADSTALSDVGTTEVFIQREMLCTT